MSDEQVIIRVANLCGLQQWQLDRSILEVIKQGCERYHYYHDIVSYVKTVLAVRI